jgi:Protein involved in mRNA turnover and stability
MGYILIKEAKMCEICHTHEAKYPLACATRCVNYETSMGYILIKKTKMCEICHTHEAKYPFACATRCVNCKDKCLGRGWSHELKSCACFKPK